jgi:5'-nucleotidase
VQFEQEELVDDGNEARRVGHPGGDARGHRHACRSIHAAPAAGRVRSARAASATGTKYTVKKGESLWTIAQAKYGNGNKWKAIAAANPKIDPNHVRAGQTIVLP